MRVSVDRLSDELDSMVFFNVLEDRQAGGLNFVHTRDYPHEEM
jgi:hypothetical protein